MSKKHFEKYLDEVSAQYHEMNEDLRDMEKLVADNMMPPEFLDKLKIMIAPVKDNWLKLNYVKFLLDMPNKKSKVAKYKNQNKKILENVITKEEVLKQNKDVLESLKNLSNS